MGKALIKILLVDDHKIVREGLRSILKERTDMRIVGEADDGLDAIRKCREMKPDLVIMDISMKNMNGIEATRSILSENPTMKVLVLSMHTERKYIQNILAAGAAGYLLKNGILEELFKAIETIMSGKVYIGSHASSILVDAFVDKAQGVDSKIDLLSPREREVLKMIADGKRTKEIASALYISPRTVEVYRAQIMKKLNLDSVAELTKFAIREGLCSLDE
ncbi:MAG: DNA-binding response regulator [Myxococcales bacterium]|nr:MAG: DNA-binding response regulator [Myxococcales bacterium]